jgi:hypothetical protein
MTKKTSVGTLLSIILVGVILFRWPIFIFVQHHLLESLKLVVLIFAAIWALFELKEPIVGTYLELKNKSKN